MGEARGGLGRARNLFCLQLVLVGGLAASAVVAQPQAVPLDGTEFLVGSASGLAARPDVELDADGNFIIIWHDGTSSPGHVYGQRFTTLGATDGGVFNVSSTVPGGGTQWEPSLSVDDLGESVVAWQSFGIDTSATGIAAKRYDSSGTVVGSHFQVNTNESNSQYWPEIDEDPVGNFVIAWSGPHPTGSSTEIRARRFDSSGTALADEFDVNSNTTGIQKRPFVGVDDDFNFVIAWSSEGDGSSYGVVAKQFDSSGAVAASDFQVNTTVTGLQYARDVAMAPDGGFIISWESANVDPDGFAAMARVYDASAVAQTGEMQLNTYTTNSQSGAKLGIDAAGNVTAVWYSLGQDSDGYAIVGRLFDSGLAAMTDELLLNSYTIDDQRRPDLAVDDAGNFVAVWESDIQNAGSAGVYARRFLGACSESLALNQDEWHLIGLPCEPPAGANTLLDVIGDDLNPGEYGITWAVFRRNATSNAYEMLTLSDTMSAGVGYWIKTTLAGQAIEVEGHNADYTDISATSYYATHGGGHDAALVGVAGTCSDGDLSDGRFNLLGHPYRMSIPFSGVLLDNASSEETVLQAATGERMMNQFWWYNGTAYQAQDACTPAMKASLDKWMGYWVNVCDTSGSYEARTPARAYDFCPPPGPPVGPEGTESLAWDGRTLRPGSAKPKPKHGDPWYLRITASSGNLSDPGNVLGELWDSVAGYDSHDLVELSPFGSPWMTVVFPHSDWGSNSSELYTSDYHGFHDERSWSLEVRSDQPRTVTLTLELTALGKKAPELEIVDGVSGAVTPVEAGSYTFTMAGTSHPFAVREAKGGGRRH